MDIHELVSQPANGWEGVARRLLRVEEKDVSLKGVFDYFRNYLICAGLLGGAVLVARHGTTFAFLPAPRVGLVVLLALIAIFLMALNLLQGVVLASAFGIRRWAGYSLGLFMFLAMSDVVVAIGIYGR